MSVRTWYFSGWAGCLPNTRVRGGAAYLSGHEGTYWNGWNTYTLNTRPLRRGDFARATYFSHSRSDDFLREPTLKMLNHACLHCLPASILLPGSSSLYEGLSLFESWRSRTGLGPRCL
eukprot:6186433-Pleurochrysis_carterae.AAC.3